MTGFAGRLMSLARLTAVVSCLAWLGAIPALAAETFQDCPDCPVMVKLENGLGFSQFPITKTEFKLFAEATKFDGKGCYQWNDGAWSMDEKADWDKPSIPQEMSHPVVCVSWLDATAYADWLSEKTGKVYRLPTLEEFQEAARAGGTTEFWWGETEAGICAVANVGDRSPEKKFKKTKSSFGCDDGFVYTSPVESFKPNGAGLYDMAGNVWQWTNSCLKGDCSNAIFRGGAWNDVWPQQFKIAESFGDRIVVRSIGLGMRVVRDPDAAQ